MKGPFSLAAKKLKEKNLVGFPPLALPLNFGSQIHRRHMASASWLLLRPWQASSHTVTVAKTGLDSGSSGEGLGRRFSFCLNGTKRHPETLKRRKSSNILHLYLEMRVKGPDICTNRRGEKNLSWCLSLFHVFHYEALREDECGLPRLYYTVRALRHHHT